MPPARAILMSEKEDTYSFSFCLLDYLHDFAHCLVNEEEKSPHTVQTYLFILKELFRFLSKHWGHQISVEIFCRITLQDVRSFLASRTHEGIKASSHAVAIAAIKRWISFLGHKGQIVDLSKDKLRRPRLPRTLPRPIDQDALMQALAEPPPQQDWIAWRDYSLLILLYATGLRIHEALQLNREKWNQDLLHILGKRGRYRVVPVLEKAKHAVDTYLALCPYTTEPLFVGARGDRLQPRVFQRYVRTWRRLHGLAEETTPHSLRHSFASHLLEEGAPLRDVQELLGHTSLKATQCYTQITPHHIRSIYQSRHPRQQVSKDTS